MLRELFDRVIEIASAQLKPTGLTDVMINANGEVTDLDEYRPSPRVFAHSATMRSADSFVAYFNRNKECRSVIFADKEVKENCPEIRAIFDFMEPTTEPTEGNANSYANPKLGWKRNSATLKLRLDSDWQSLRDIAKNSLSQESFAEWLEDHRDNITGTNHAELIEIVERMKITSGVRFESKINRSTGETTFSYADEQIGAGTVTIPHSFKFIAPVYEHGAIEEIEVRIRYRLRDGALSFTLAPYRMDVAEDSAFRKIIGDIETGTGTNVFI